MYVIIDPINDKNKGITTYCDLLYKYIKSYGIDTFLYKKRKNQDITSFYKEVLTIFNGKDVLFEIPDAFCYLFPDLSKAHIRLHGNQAVLQQKQGLKVDTERLRKEAIAINKSRYLSSPSLSNLNELKRLIKLKRNCLIYPNPIPTFTESTLDRDLEITFIGRFQHLKGINFLKKFEKKINKQIYIYTPSIPFWDKFFYKVIPHGISKQIVLHRSQVIVIPSLFESFSMVKYEALSSGCKVVTWDSTPFSQDDESMGVYVAKSYLIDDFTSKIEIAAKDSNLENYKKSYVKFYEETKLSILDNIKEMTP